jgi:hypothetical protein
MMFVAPDLSDGVGWARRIALNFYYNQNYVMIIDSHTRFIQDWDVIVISEFKKALHYSDKPILSCYLADTTWDQPLKPDTDMFGRQIWLTVSNTDIFG